MQRLRLDFLSGPRRGDASVFSAPRVSLGRSRSNTFVLPETVAPAASGHHAEFVYEDGGWWLVDQRSTNGTYLNGARVTRASVAAGDRVTIGDVELRVGFADARPRAAWAVAAAVALLLALAGGYWLIAIRPGEPERVAEAASRSVYLIALERNGSRTSVGTAFAVNGEGLLATNAHVVAALAPALAAPSPGVRALAVRSDGFDAHRIVSVRTHPEWRTGSIAHDVAVVKLADAIGTVALPLAPPAAVTSLRRGVVLSSFGFPAVSTNPARPRGRLSVDVLSDVRLPFLEVGLGIAPGTSGSPVFAADGSVVALVVSGDFVGGPPGVPARPSGTNVNWAIAVDELRILLRPPEQQAR